LFDKLVLVFVTPAETEELDLRESIKLYLECELEDEEED